MERSHPLSKDRGWMPASVRRARMLTSAGLWTAGSVGIVGAIAAAPWTIVLGKLWVFGIAGVAVAGERAGHAVMHRQLGRMTRGKLPLTDLGNRAEGDLVVVRGTIEAGETLRGLLNDSEGVYRRAEIKGRGTWISEAAVDFSLVDDAGNRILIQAAGARWMVPSREKFSYPADKFIGDHVPRRITEITEGKRVLAYERVLPVGAKVQIVGYKTESADASGTTTDYRTAPQRATLRSGDDLPLVITLLSDLQKR